MTIYSTSSEVLSAINQSTSIDGIGTILRDANDSGIKLDSDELKNVVLSQSVSAGTAKTVLLYSGSVDGQKSIDIAKAVANSGDGVAIIDNTNAASLISNSNFRTALNNSFSDNSGYLNESARDTFLFGETNSDGVRTSHGLWGDLSEKFVTENNFTEARTIGPLATSDSIMSQIEIPAILSKTTIQKIDGIDTSELRAGRDAIGGSMDIVIDQVKQASGANFSLLEFATSSSDGSLLVGTQKFFGINPDISGSPLPSDATNIKSGASMLASDGTWGSFIDELTDTNILSKSTLAKLGVAGDLLSIIFVIKDADAATAEGDQDKANDILQTWSAEFLGGTLGSIAAVAMIAPVIPLVTSSAFIAGTIALAAGVTGGIYGGEAGTYLLDKGKELGAFASNAVEAFQSAVTHAWSDVTSATHTITQSISNAYGDFSNSVTNAIRRIDPLIIDLNGDGLKLSSWQESGVTFDLNADGFSESTGWTTASSDDAFLVLDKNSNGNADSIDELFGNSSSTGFEVLSKFDSNADNLISSNDAQFNLLKLWKDSNANGVVNEGELTSLADNGITEISLKTLNNLYSSSGNLVTETAEVKITDSQTNIVSTRIVSEVLFAMNQFNSSIVNPDEALGPNFTLDVNTLLLPYSRGYGSLNSWQVAMTLNSELLETAQTLANLSPTNFYQINSLFETFLFQWAGVEDFTSAQVYESGTSTKIDHRKVAFLEKATGLDFRVPNDAVIAQAQTSWDLFYNTLLARFLTQGTFKEIFPEASYSFSTDTTSINTSLDEAITNILSLSGSLDKNSFLNYAYYSKTILQLNKDQFTSETNASFDTKVNGMLNSIINSVTIPNFSFNGIFNIGTDAAETLYGAVNSDILKGESGDDFIYAESGNDYIEGNEGSDYLKGGAGDDIYKFNLGDGQDTIEETSGSDKIVFGSGITQTSLAFARIGNDLLIRIGSGSDKIGIKNFYTATTNRVKATLDQSLFIQKVIANDCIEINKNEFFMDQNYV